MTTDVAAGADATAGLGPPGRVLMVDDRPGNLLALEAVLGPLGAELVRAGSGEEGLRRLLSADFALIILDVQMPGMDGFETAELIKAREKTSQVPIIFLTAISGDAEHHLRGYRTGAVDYLNKPFSPEALRAKASVFLELWRQRDLLARQRVQLADQLLELDRLNSELERSNASLERFAAAAAVEIQEPVDNAAGLFELLATRHRAALDDEAMMLIDRSRANVARVRDRVAVLLEYARASVRFRLDPVSLDEVVTEAAGEMGGLLSGGDVSLVMGELPQVRGDRGRLVKLLWHLLHNSVEHGAVRPLTIRVTGPAGSVGSAGSVIITVADDGKGIAPELQPLLFSLLPFGSPAPSHAPAGLAICRRIVEGHGGSIWCESSGRGGAAFSFTLPALRS